MYPVTAVLGPVASLNVLTIFTPVLNTLAACRLMRLVSGASGLAVTGAAALIGFSPLVMMHNGARLQLVFEALTLLLLSELWILGRDRVASVALSGRRVVAIGALVGAQLWIGSEQLAIVAIIVLVGLAVALVLGRHDVSRRHFAISRRDLRMIGAGVAVTLVVSAPFLITYLFGRERYTAGYHVPARPLFGLRLANLFTPTNVTLLHSHLPLAVASASVRSATKTRVMSACSPSWPSSSSCTHGVVARGCRGVRCSLLVDVGCWLSGQR